MKRYFTEDKKPMEIVRVISSGAVFTIAEISGGSSFGLVGLFLEDDDNRFLVSRFDLFWLPELERVAREAHNV